MFKLIRQKASPKKNKNGFNITELAITTAMIGTLGSIAYPNYIASKGRAQCSETKATLTSIPPIISAYIDATGEAPTTWENLSSIAVVMSSSGPATGELGTPITLPRNNYKLSIEGPSESIYSLSANCFIKTQIDNPENGEEENPDKDKYVIRSCFNVSNGASSITRGSGTDPANTPNCG
jgi:type II secretory pathway pseudopilin PulG